MGEAELMSTRAWQRTFEMAKMPFILLFFWKKIIEEKKIKPKRPPWGVILRVYKKAHFVDKIWTVWEIYKTLKSCTALQNLKQQETVIFLKQVFIKVIGYSWCGIKRKKKLLRRLYWTWHKSEVCNLGAERRARNVYTQYLWAAVVPKSWRQEQRAAASPWPVPRAALPGL